MRKSAVHIGFELSNPETKKLEFVDVYCFSEIWPGMRISKDPKQSTCTRCIKAHSTKRTKIYKNND